METDLRNLQDSELITKYNEGESICAKILFERYRNYIDELCRFNPINKISFEDKQEITYLKFMQAFSKYKKTNGASFKTYITRCIRNSLLDELRKQNRKKASELEIFPFDSSLWEEHIELQSYKEWKQAINS